MSQIWNASPSESHTTIPRILVLLYGLIAYGVFFGTFLYAIGFVGNIGVPKSIDSGPVEPLGQALVINLVLLALFAIQHSGMARPGFKAWWTRCVPHALERSTYVLLASLVLLLVFWQWRPIPELVWDVQQPLGQAVLYGIFAGGWALVLLATILIGHFELFGIQRVAKAFSGTSEPPPTFKTPGLYAYVRHPIMLGFLIAFWATPAMSYGHLLFALGTTAYILIALPIEERDLIQVFGETYRRYRHQVPMLIPLGKKRGT